MKKLITIILTTAVVITFIIKKMDVYTANNEIVLVDSITSHSISRTPHEMKFIPAKDSSLQINRHDSTWVITFENNFWMDSTEVTQGSFDYLMLKYHPEYANYNKDSIRKTGNSRRKPVYGLDYFGGMAMLYCNARSNEEGKDTAYSYDSLTYYSSGRIRVWGAVLVNMDDGYRLPTENEWEYAYRAGTKSTFYWGESTLPGTLDKYLRYDANCNIDDITKHDYGVGIIATRTPNNWGLYDMAGNIYETCHRSYKDLSPVEKGGTFHKPMRGSMHRFSAVHRAHAASSLKGFRCILPANE